MMHIHRMHHLFLLLYGLIEKAVPCTNPSDKS